jgi:hypothetical protein
MRKVTLSLVFALAVLAFATAAHAKIFVNISDGTNTLNAQLSTTVPFVKGGLRLSQASPAPTGLTDVTVVVNVLTCAVRPCTVFFPSGAASQQAGDTFKIADVSSASLARVEKFDSGASADRVSFKGVKITSLVAGRILTITYGVQAGDLRALTSTSTSYTGTAALTGSFKTSTGLRATDCTAGLTSTEVADPCVKLSIALNGTTVNGAGATAVATVAVPCNNSFPTVNPCGTNGSYTSSLGSFTGVNDSKSLSCASICLPTQVGTVVAKFNGANEVLQLTASANGGMANIPDEEGGLEEVFLTLADELGANRWVAYTAASERCRAVPKSPTTLDTRNINNNSTLPISFEYWCGFFASLPAGSGVDLLSIVDEKESVLAGTALTRNDAARVGFLPAQGQLQLKDITVLSLSYDVFVGTAPSGNGALGDLTFTDCAGGSLRVELQVLNNQGNPAGTAKVYLGSNPADDFQSLCNGFQTIGTDLVNNPDARVDTSGLVGNLASPCCITFGQLQQGTTGKLRVRKMSLIVDHGTDTTEFANHKVMFFDGNVNGFNAFSTLQVVTDVTRTFELSTNGVSIVITKLGGTFGQGVVKVIRSGEIVINGGKFTASVNVNDIQPESGAEYTIALCPSGAETDSGAQTDPLLPPGLCIGDQAFMTLL